MQSLALDYFALRDERSTDLEDLPLARVKWQWDAPPLAEALMQLRPPFEAMAIASNLDVEEAEEEHLPEIDGIGIVDFPWLHEAWPVEGPSIQAQAELLRPRSLEWLSHYAAQRRDSPSEVAMKQVDQECEWMNMVAESHDLLKQEVQADRNQDVRMSQSMGRWPCTRDPCSSAPQEPGQEEATHRGEQAEQAVDCKTMKNEAPKLLSKPLSKLWLGEGAVRRLDVTQLGLQKLPSIWSEVQEVDIPRRDDVRADVSQLLGPFWLTPCAFCLRFECPTKILEAGAPCELAFEELGRHAWPAFGSARMRCWTYAFHRHYLVFNYQKMWRTSSRMAL